MDVREFQAPRQALLACLFVAAAALMSAALLTVAALAPAPPAALPAIAVVCIGCPIAASYNLRDSVGALRRAIAWRRADRHLSRLRRELERLPETEHPLGL